MNNATKKLAFAELLIDHISALGSDFYGNQISDNIGTLGVELIIDYIFGLGSDFHSNEIRDDICKLGFDAGLCSQVEYDPDKHSGVEDTDEGDLIWWWKL